jgi:hypothetical protein
VKIRMHSITDLITNSSTVIYTYSDANLGACREMIDAIFHAFGVDKKCDDVFGLAIEYEDDDFYTEYLDNKANKKDLPEGYNCDMGYKKKGEWLTEALESATASGIKPDWMLKAEKWVNDYRDFAPSTNLVITPKDPVHAPLAELIRKFLYSTTQEATREG